MRYLFLISALVFSTFAVQAQLEEWMPARPITDSSHFNRNPTAYYSWNEDILFWEQELNETTTQICCRSFDEWELGDVSVLLFSPNTRFTNPQVINLDEFGNTTNYMLIYQTNEGDDIDLKFVIRNANGTFSDPGIVSSLAGDDIGLSISDNDFPMVTWENGGKIWVSSYLYQENTFSVPFAIDSVGCFSPVAVGWNTVSYLKENGDSTAVYSVDLSYTGTGDWQLFNLTHVSFFGECSNLTSGSFFGALCMQNKAGTEPWKIMIKDYESISLSSPIYNLTQPAIEGLIIYVDLSAYFLAYVSDSLGPGEIFVSDPYNIFTNISNWSGEDNSPVFFFSFPNSYTGRVDLFWKSERDGYTTIYNSYYDYLVGSTGTAIEVSDVNVFPNPANNLTTITINCSEVKSVNIFDLKGHKIRTLSISNSHGTCTVNWDGADAHGRQVPPGGYIVVARTNAGNLNRVIVRSN